MFVAIINQTNPSGVVPVQQFQVAADVATAVAEYVAAFKPPKDPADWLGFDTGWVAPRSPGKGMEWGYDFDAPGLVTIPLQDRLTGLALTQVISDPKADPSGGSTPFAWEDMGLLSAAFEFFTEDADDLLIKVWGQHKTAFLAGSTPQIRLSAGGAALSDEIDLPDTAGAWQNFAVTTHGYALDFTRTLYKVQTKLRHATNTVELQAVSIALFKKNYD